MLKESNNLTTGKKLRDWRGKKTSMKVPLPTTGKNPRRRKLKGRYKDPEELKQIRGKYKFIRNWVDWTFHVKLYNLYAIKNL